MTSDKNSCLHYYKKHEPQNRRSEIIMALTFLICGIILSVYELLTFFVKPPLWLTITIFSVGIIWNLIDVIFAFPDIQSYWKNSKNRSQFLVLLIGTIQLLGLTLYNTVYEALNLEGLISIKNIALDKLCSLSGSISFALAMWSCCLVACLNYCEPRNENDGNPDPQKPLKANEIKIWFLNGMVMTAFAVMGFIKTSSLVSAVTLVISLIITIISIYRIKSRPDIQHKINLHNNQDSDTDHKNKSLKSNSLETENEEMKYASDIFGKNAFLNSIKQCFGCSTATID